MKFFIFRVVNQLLSKITTYFIASVVDSQAVQWIPNGIFYTSRESFLFIVLGREKTAVGLRM